MRYLPFKILVFCILLPPFCYVFSLQFMENAIEKRYTKALQAVVAGDTQLLFNGTVKLKDAINKNIEKFEKQKTILSIGVKANITVLTGEGAVLYPLMYEEERKNYLQTDPMIIARDNYRMLTDGLTVKVQIKIDHNTILSNLMLLFFISLFLSVLGLFYRSGIKKAKKDELDKKKRIEKLEAIRTESLSNLSDLENMHEALSGQLNIMKHKLDEERRKAIDTEDEMVEEMVALEEKIAANEDLYEEKEIKIAELKATIEQLEKTKTKKNIRPFEATRKRFLTLYKNIDVNDRAISGFIELTEDMKIKAEEVIHQLNDDPKAVTIKRKVFGKKSRETVFEIIFAYKGRLYFRNTHKTGVEVLAVGTKHTQGSDLAFLDKL